MADEKTTSIHPLALTDDLYRAGMDLIASSFRAIQLVPLDALRDALTRAETLAPMLDPTAYMRGGRDNLEDQRDLLDAAYKVRAAVERIAKRRGVDLTAVTL